MRSTLRTLGALLAGGALVAGGTSGCSSPESGPRSAACASAEATFEEELANAKDMLMDLPASRPQERAAADEAVTQRWVDGELSYDEYQLERQKVRDAFAAPAKPLTDAAENQKIWCYEGGPKQYYADRQARQDQEREEQQAVEQARQEAEQATEQKQAEAREKAVAACDPVVIGDALTAEQLVQMAQCPELLVRDKARLLNAANISGDLAELLAGDDNYVIRGLAAESGLLSGATLRALVTDPDKSVRSAAIQRLGTTKADGKVYRSLSSSSSKALQILLITKLGMCSERDSCEIQSLARSVVKRACTFNVSANRYAEDFCADLN